MAHLEANLNAPIAAGSSFSRGKVTYGYIFTLMTRPHPACGQRMQCVAVILQNTKRLIQHCHLQRSHTRCSNFQRSILRVPVYKRIYALTGARNCGEEMTRCKWHPLQSNSSGIERGKNNNKEQLTMRSSMAAKLPLDLRGESSECVCCTRCRSLLDSETGVMTGRWCTVIPHQSMNHHYLVQKLCLCSIVTIT